MKVSDAMVIALREFADPACWRCRGRGAKGDDVVAGLCRCVKERVPDDAGAPPDEDLPHPWGAITRRAQHIHAAVLLQAVPDDWS